MGQHGTLGLRRVDGAELHGFLRAWIICDRIDTAISGGLVSLADKGAIKVIGGALSEEKGIDGQKFLASDAAYQAGVTAPAMLDGKSFGMTTAGSSFHYMGSKMAQAEGIDFRIIQIDQGVGVMRKTGAPIHVPDMNDELAEATFDDFVALTGELPIISWVEFRRWLS